MGDEEPPTAPSLLWRFGSATVIGVTGFLARSFLLGANRLEVHGLDAFVDLLEERKDVKGRQRGLITVSNHLSVIDDPTIWGALPFRYHWDPNNNRWSLGSHDLMFKNPVTSLFFSLGQCLPTHRLHHSPHGGLFQPTITESIKLLSARPFTQQTHASNPSHEPSNDFPDPFTHPTTSPSATYTTTGKDTHPSPSYHSTRQHAWLHVFPEGRIHQHPSATMRYFKWGISRLILESEPCPDVVPIWIEGLDKVMHESRGFPRFVPRGGREVVVVFGGRVDVERVFGDLRERWSGLVRADERGRRGLEGQDGRREVCEDVKAREMGVLSESLKYGEDAVRLREECTMRIREQVLKLRHGRGWSEEDPKARLVDTWREEGAWEEAFDGKREGKMKDGSWVKDT